MNYIDKILINIIIDFSLGQIRFRIKSLTSRFGLRDYLNTQQEK